MPTYDYHCRSCGNVTEVIHSMLEPGPTHCELCGGDLRRVIYPAGIIFKGSGFYRNDSRGADTSGDGRGNKTGSGKSGGEPAPAPAAADATSGASPTGDAGKKDKKKSDAPST